MLLEEKDDASRWDTSYDANFSFKLKSILGDRDMIPFSSPTPDDEASCATHTDEPTLYSVSFFDDVTPLHSPRILDNNSAAYRKRDSHELALSPRANRESLVDHMLLSFDNLKTDYFSFERGGSKAFGRNPSRDKERLYSGFDEHDSYQSVPMPMARNGGGMRRQTSYSTDGEDINQKSIYSLGRRSRPRLRSTDTQGKALTDISVEQRLEPQVEYQVQTQQRKFHRSYSQSGPRKDKGSSSIDLNYSDSPNSHKWARNQSGRSSSFDYRRGFHHTVNSQLRGLSAKYDSSQYDIAFTTSHINSGRSKSASPAGMSHLESTNLYNYQTKLETKSSTKSMRSYKAHKLPERSDSRAAIITLTGPKKSFDERNDSINQSNKLPQVPALKKKRQPSQAKLKKGSSPSSAVTSLSSTPVNAAAQSKERPGFFRRVFGSSKNHVRNNAHDQNLDYSPPHSSSSSIETTDLQKFRTPPFDTKSVPIRETLLSDSPPSPPSPKFSTPQRSTTVTALEEYMPNLNRKPSSFFRRRKKSTSSRATNVPPIMQPRTPYMEISMDKMLPNPPSSLPTVLHPYLQTFYPSVELFVSPEFEDQCDDSAQDTDNEVLKSFSPTYDAISTATIRHVKENELETTPNLGSYFTSKQFSASSNRPRSPDTGFEGIGNEPDATFNQGHNENWRDVLEIKSTFVNPLTAHPLGDTVPAFLDRDYLPESLHSSRKLANSDAEEFFWTRSHPLISRQEMTESPSSIKRTHIARQHSEDWVKISESKTLIACEKDDRVWLEPSSDEEENTSPQVRIAENVLSNRCRMRSESKTSIDRSTISLSDSPEKKIGSDRLCDNEIKPIVQANTRISTVHEEDVSDKNNKEVEIAHQIFDGNDSTVSKDRAAAWLGDEDISHARVLEAYFCLHDFKNLSILDALRKLCSRLILKAESQQVDRILVAFSMRWSECNPFHLFKNIDVVHTVTYSLLLLNTDLHLADIEQKMSRSQYIKNTMPTIRQIITEALPNPFEAARPSVLQGKCVVFENILGNQDKKLERASLETERPSYKVSNRPTIPKSDVDTVFSTPHEIENSADDSGHLIGTSYRGTLRTWEVQLEMILKAFYNSIRNEPLTLYGSLTDKSNMHSLHSSNNLSLFNNNFLRRTPSVLSYTPSDTQSYRSRAADSLLRVGNGKRMNKIRSRPRLYQVGSGLGSSRTSLDDQSSILSPVSSTWSKYSLGKTPTSVSVDSMASAWPSEEYQQSIGFANVISQAIIREEIGSPGIDLQDNCENDLTPLLEEESLELYGAPWAKEGLVKHKHHLESIGKRARERSWTEVFAVIEKGFLRLFTFSNKSRRQKTKGKITQPVVGGGNWQENAQSLGSFLLQQTIASALPSPGYSKTRPYVWALSLPTGAVHLFQVGTPDVVKEFVSTANYWGARLSNHPLVGGISNIEYGWSDTIINMIEKTPSGVNDIPKRPTTSSRDRPSISGQSPGSVVGRHSIDLGTTGASRPRILGERFTISDWTPPTQSMRASTLSEEDQLSALIAYVSGIEEELQKHNKLRNPMLQAFGPRQPYAQKAMANWEKKSAYLLREIVKFTTYIDSLKAASACKRKIYEEREQKKKEKELVTQDAIQSGKDMSTNNK